MSKKEYKIVTVCGAGVGTSNFLKTNVEEVLSDLNVNGYVENVSLSRVKTIKPDLIMTFSTFDTQLDDLDTDVIIIKNLFDKKEIEEKLANYFSQKENIDK